MAAKHTVYLDTRLRVFADGRQVGTVERVDRRTYHGRGMDGKLVAANVYAYGGAALDAASLLASRVLEWPDGDSYHYVNAKGRKIFGGPWTLQRRAVA